MVGDDHHPAPGRDALPFLVPGGKTELEVVEHLLDKVEAPHMGIGGGELLEFLLVEQQAQHPGEGFGQVRALLIEIRVAVLQEGFDIEHGVLRDLAGTLALVFCRNVTVHVTRFTFHVGG